MPFHLDLCNLCYGKLAQIECSCLLGMGVSLTKQCRIVPKEEKHATPRDELEDIVDDFMVTRARRTPATPVTAKSTGRRNWEGSTMVSAKYKVIHCSQTIREEEDVDVGGGVRRDSQSPTPVNIEVFEWQRGELLGAGAFGKVYMGLNMGSGEMLAVKQVNLKELGADSKEAAALEHEIGMMKSLSHPHIVQYLGTDRTEDMLNIFLEYVSGGSISSILRKFGSLTEAVVQKYTAQMLLGLNYLHQHRIIHRDIKGANILVDTDGTVKLADFGASKRLRAMGVGSGARSLQGTPFWMAPEVIRQSGASRQSDIWSVGCTVLEMLTGSPPWSQFTDQVSALWAIANTESGPPIPENVSTECKEFLELCFQQDPKNRPSATQLLKHAFLANYETRRQSLSGKERRDSARKMDRSLLSPNTTVSSPGSPKRPLSSRRAQQIHDLMEDPAAVPSPSPSRGVLADEGGDEEGVSAAVINACGGSGGEGKERQPAGHIELQKYLHQMEVDREYSRMHTFSTSPPVTDEKPIVTQRLRREWEMSIAEETVKSQRKQREQEEWAKALKQELEYQEAMKESGDVVMTDPPLDGSDKSVDLPGRVE